MGIALMVPVPLQHRLQHEFYTFDQQSRFITTRRRLDRPWVTLIKVLALTRWWTGTSDLGELPRRETFGIHPLQRLPLDIKGQSIPLKSTSTPTTLQEQLAVVYLRRREEDRTRMYRSRAAREKGISYRKCQS
jgi:hypothetical protein